jgi:hypothetical protein
MVPLKSLFRLALAQEYKLQIVVCFRIIRLQRQRLLIIRYRLVQFVLRLQRQPQVVVCKGMPRILPERLTDPLDRLRTVSRLVGDDTQQVQRIKVRQLCSQYLPNTCR